MVRHFGQPAGVHDLQAGRRPPYDIAAKATRIDAARDLTGAVLDLGVRLEENVTAARAGDMRSRHRNIGVVVPIQGFGMFEIQNSSR